MSKEINTPSGNVQSRRKDYYIVEDEMGEKFLLLYYGNFRILKSEKIFKDMWAVYSEDEVLRSNGKKPVQPLVAKNRYIIIDLPNFVQLRKSIGSREDFWLKLLSQGPLNVPESEDPVFAGARNRLRVSRMKPDLFKALEDKMFEEKHVREAIEAEAYLKGEARGAADERSRNEAANAARDSQRAEFLRSHNVPNELISEMLAIK